MSRIGKLPITVPGNVKINFSDSKVLVEGPKGKLSLNVNPEIVVTQKDNILTVSPKNPETLEKTVKSLYGLYRVLINNMIVGVTAGYQKKLEIIGTGYKAALDGKKLILNLGYSHPINFPIPEGITVVVENNTNVSISGIDKQLVGEVASVIRKMKLPEPYKGKGVKYDFEKIKRKAGKAT